MCRDDRESGNGVRQDHDRRDHEMHQGDVHMRRHTGNRGKDGGVQYEGDGHVHQGLRGHRRCARKERRRDRDEQVLRRPSIRSARREGRPQPRRARGRLHHGSEREAAEPRGLREMRAPAPRVRREGPRAIRGAAHRRSARRRRPVRPALPDAGPVARRPRARRRAHRRAAARGRCRRYRKQHR